MSPMLTGAGPALRGRGAGHDAPGLEVDIVLRHFEKIEGPPPSVGRRWPVPNPTNSRVT